jgi:GTPase SAR1 family protein
MEDVMIILVGNKSDLEDERMVTLEDALALKNEFNMLYFIETSAKSGDNVLNAFSDISKFLYIKYKERLLKDDVNAGETRESKYGIDKLRSRGLEGVRARG